ncbi:prostatic acid phosphatase-like isoform X2 [Contarinia nasturtii]|uniref:prostatic acid phosphatase-like isoform X2 n=1 Tax=Contarinia nasturtii TaxID=265458 RepID=UPI0012D3D78F|nr:prostatic acid phosphatase-like isoform X2 [Contarinia nasturtii]
MLLFLLVILLSLKQFSVTALPHQDSFDRRNEVFRNDDKLIFVQIYRHGFTNIKNISYPNDPYRNESNWVGGFHQLNNVRLEFKFHFKLYANLPHQNQKEGKREMFELGQYFRRRYNELLGDKYSANRVYVRSTDTDRSICSALCNLAGLFPPTVNETWNENILWQPIPVHSVPIHLDYVLWGPPDDCQAFFAAYDKYQRESPEVKRIYADYADEFAHWSEMCGKKLITIYDVTQLYNTLRKESLLNKTLASWAQEAIKPKGVMEYIASFNQKLKSDTKELARLQSGFLIKEIFERFGQKINSTLQPNRSIWYYSAHDTTISSMLNSLGLLELHILPFACSLHFELYEVDGNEHYIQVFYRKSNEEFLAPLNIPNCGEKCSLDQLYKLYNDIIPDCDHDIECGLIKDSY